MPRPTGHRRPGERDEPGHDSLPGAVDTYSQVGAVRGSVSAPYPDSGTGVAVTQHPRLDIPEIRHGTDTGRPQRLPAAEMDTGAVTEPRTDVPEGDGVRDGADYHQRRPIVPGLL